MIEAVMIWNEPNNKSHWDPQVDPEWRLFANMAALAGEAIKAENPHLLRVLGGISPIDPDFIRNMSAQGVLEHVDVVAVHGFPLDWNLWQIHEWPEKIAAIRAVTALPVWVTEVGVSTFGAEEIQVWGARAHCAATRRPDAAHPLVQPVRPATRVGSHHSPPRGRGLLVLPAFLHGPAA